MRIVFHIGHPKCGSTTIQAFLRANWMKVHAQGVGYLDWQLDLYHKKSEINPPVNYFKRMKEGEISAEDLSQRIERVIVDAKKKSMHTLIISAENLADPYFPAVLKRAIPELDVTVLYYIRRPDDWILSAWKQWQVKAGKSLQQFIDSHIASNEDFYRPVIQAWQAEFPSADYQINYLSRDMLRDGDLVTDAMHRIAIDTQGMTRVENENLSLDYDLLRVLAECPFLFNDMNDNTLFNDLRRHLGPSVSASDEDPLTPEQRRTLLDAHADEISWINDQFFAGKLPAFAIKSGTKRPSRSSTDSEFQSLAKMQGLQLQLLLKLLNKS